MALDRLTEVHFRLPGCQRCENGACGTRSPRWGITWPIVKQVHVAIWLKWVQYLSCIVDIKLVHGLALSVLWLSAGMALDKVIMNDFPYLNGKIEIHDSQCNLRCRAINIFKIFCRMNTLGPNNILKMTRSQYSGMTLASLRLQPWATRLFVQQIIQTNNKVDTKDLHHWVLWEPPITAGFSSQMGRWCGNSHWYYDS